RWSCQTPSAIITATAASTSSVGISGQRRAGVETSAGPAGSVILVLHLATFGGLPLMFAREQGRLTDTQPIDHGGGGQRHPQQYMHPKGRTDQSVERQGDRDQQRSDDQRQERRR